MSYLKLMEIRNLNKDSLSYKDLNGTVAGQVCVLPGVEVGEWNLSARAWSLIGSKFDEHPMIRMLKSYGLDVKLSPTLENWLKKETRRIEREATPLQLPEFADTRTLFDKVEAGMVLHCKKEFTVDKKVIFKAGERYQVVDTTRSGTEGSVKVFKQPIVPNIKIVLSGPDIFEWTAFHGAMEDVFDYEEKIIYDPAKCVPAKYPELYAYYQKKIKDAMLELFDHTQVDLPQMATKRDVADLKLMRMGKTREAIGLVWCGAHRSAAGLARGTPASLRCVSWKLWPRTTLNSRIMSSWTSCPTLTSPGSSIS